VARSRTGTKLAADFARAMAGMPWPGAVAVSGGGDSLALMHLLADWARRTRRPPPLVLTVDHGLRPGSAAVARNVARRARAAGLRCEILTAAGPAPEADIEAWARDTRLALMGERLGRRGLSALYVAHSRDDQAETFLMRLARGSGLDGLAAMRPLAPFPLPGFEGLSLVRPLLGIGRAALREDLSARGQGWLEDPMNADPRFLRVRIRALLPQLEAAGLPVARIADAAAHLARAREALDLATAAVLSRALKADGQGILLDAAALAAAPREIGLRALAAVLGRVSGAAYRPRFESLERLYDRILAGKLGGGATLQGCRIGPAPARKRVFGPPTLSVIPESSPRRAAKRN